MTEKQIDYVDALWTEIAANSDRGFDLEPGNTVWAINAIYNPEVQVSANFTAHSDSGVAIIIEIGGKQEAQLMLRMDVKKDAATFIECIRNIVGYV